METISRFNIAINLEDLRLLLIQSLDLYIFLHFLLSNNTLPNIHICQYVYSNQKVNFEILTLQSNFNNLNNNSKATEDLFNPMRYMYFFII